MPKISVIVPVYNTVAHLPQCLDSLINQTLQDIEIICIDDGSTDGSLKILEEYAKLNFNIKLLIFNYNNGVSKARNAGIELATGEYIAFVDSDDFVDLNFYETLYKKAKESNAEIVKAAFYHDDSMFALKEYENNKAIHKNKYLFYINFTTAIYKKNIVLHNKIYFPEGIENYEDVVFLVQIVHFANTVEIVDGVYYHYINRVDSASRKVDNLKILEMCCSSGLLISHFINSANVLQRDYDFIFFKVIFVLILFGSKLKEIPSEISKIISYIIFSYKYMEPDKKKKLFCQKIPYTNANVVPRLYMLIHKFYDINKINTKDLPEILNICTAPSVCLYIDRNNDTVCIDKLKFALSKLITHGCTVFVVYQSLNSKIKNYICNFERSKVFFFSVHDCSSDASHNTNTCISKQFTISRLDRLTIFILTRKLRQLRPDIFYSFDDNKHIVNFLAATNAMIPNIIIQCEEINKKKVMDESESKSNFNYENLLGYKEVFFTATSKKQKYIYSNILNIPSKQVIVL